MASTAHKTELPLPICPSRAISLQIDALSGPLESLLISGGDSRLSLNSASGLNRYGCRPRPEPEGLKFASSTATTISSRGFAAASALRRQLLKAANEEELADACDDQGERLRSQIRTTLGLDARVEIVFSPSGTDSEIHALYICQALLGGAVVSIIVAADETGSGVAQATLGRHFGSSTARGAQVREGKPIPGFAEGTVGIAIPVRDRSGGLRSRAALEEDVAAAVAQAVASGKRVILHVMDCSKFGWRGPGLECVRRIQQSSGRSVEVVVDACQLRLSRQRLAYYLNQGCMVLITGSKYFAGPPFSGALLIPPATSRRMNVVSEIVPDGLRCYSTRNDWPVRWRGVRSKLPIPPNVGQLLRWAAAAEELRAYFAIPASYRSCALQLFSSNVERLIAARPSLQLLPECESSGGDSLDEEEMASRTIFPFFLRRDGQLLSVDGCRRIYRALNCDVSPLLDSSATAVQRQAAAIPCQLGQPVGVLHPLQGCAGTLRISAGARVVLDSWCADGEAASLVRLNRQLDDVRLVLDKIDLLVDRENRPAGQNLKALKCLNPKSR